MSIGNGGNGSVTTRQVVPKHAVSAINARVKEATDIIKSAPSIGDIISGELRSIAKSIEIERLKAQEIGVAETEESRISKKFLILRKEYLFDVKEDAAVSKIHKIITDVVKMNHPDLVKVIEDLAERASRIYQQNYKSILRNAGIPESEAGLRAPA
jgi:hypothetical protein